MDKREIFGDTFDFLQKQLKGDEILICDAQSETGSMYSEKKIQNDDDLGNILRHAKSWGLVKIKYYAVKKASWS